MFQVNPQNSILVVNNQAVSNKIKNNVKGHERF